MVSPRRTTSISTVSASLPRISAARCSLRANMMFMPMLKLLAAKSVCPPALHSASTAGRSASQPVVPQTTGSPAAQQRLMLATAVAGVVNSMATSASICPGHGSSRSILQATVWPRPMAIASMA